MGETRHVLVGSVYDGMREGNIQYVLSLISEFLKGEKTGKLRLTPNSLLNSVGRELGKLLIKDDWGFKRLMELWRVGGRDERLIVINALGETGRKNYENSKSFVLSILNDVLDWEVCDQLALRVVVNLVVENKDEMFSLMRGWVRSENKWVRRLAVATIPPYIRRRETESKMCLQFLEGVMHERDEDVKKAVGWALREVSKKDPESVFEFLKKWSRIEDKNVKAIIRDGMRKLRREEREEIKSLLGG
jgi:3-methyladenine DNA glycosylase AlkD